MKYDYFTCVVLPNSPSYPFTDESNPIGVIVFVPQESGKNHIGISKYNRKAESSHDKFNLDTGYAIAVVSATNYFTVTLPELITFGNGKTIRSRVMVNCLCDLCSRKNGVPPKNITFVETMRSLRYDRDMATKRVQILQREKDHLRSKISSIQYYNTKVRRKMDQIISSIDGFDPIKY
jgi:hypothetical protein